METVVCKRIRPRRHRVQLNITVDPHILEAFKAKMAEYGEKNLSNFLEGLMECFIRDSCEGCPAYEELPEEEKRRVQGKVMAGKWIEE